MSSYLDETMMTISDKMLAENDSTTIQYTQPEQNPSPNITQNTSFQDGCINFSQNEFLPWNNPSNIVSENVEIIIYRFKNNMLVFLFLIGGPANVINMAVFYRQDLKERVNLCLFALSLADEIYLLVAMFLHGEQLYLQFTTKERYGPMLTFLLNNNIVFLSCMLYVSPVLSAIIASERCLCILSPLKFRRFLRTRTMAAIIITVYVTVLSLYFIVTLRFRIGCVNDPVSGTVILRFTEGRLYKAHKNLINLLDGVVFALALPAVVMIVVLTTTIITIVKLRNIVTWRADISPSISAREVGLTKMLIGNSIFFIACLFPVSVTRFSWLFFPEMKFGGRNENLFVSSLWIIELFSYINATFNIFVYYTMGSRYRETFWSLFNRKGDSVTQGTHRVTHSTLTHTF